MVRVLQPIQGDLDFHHENWEISKVTFEIAGVGSRRILVSPLPSHVTETQITNGMSTYGYIKKIHDEVSLHAYRFKVKPGVRLVDISLRKHIHSQIKLDGHRAVISYEGQPMTFYRCSEQGHQINGYQSRKIPGSQQTSYDANSWTNMVKCGTKKAQSVGNNGTNDVSLSPNGEARRVVEFQSPSLDQDAHNEQDPMTVEHQLCPRQTR